MQRNGGTAFPLRERCQERCAGCRPCWQLLPRRASAAARSVGHGRRVGDGSRAGRSPGRSREPRAGPAPGAPAGGRGTDHRPRARGAGNGRSGRTGGEGTGTVECSDTADRYTHHGGHQGRGVTHLELRLRERLCLARTRDGGKAELKSLPL